MGSRQLFPVLPTAEETCPPMLTEPARETPVRLTSSAQIQAKRSKHVPGLHSFLAPTPATGFFYSLSTEENRKLTKLLEFVLIPGGDQALLSNEQYSEPT